jgi:hypothetical protein
MERAALLAFLLAACHGVEDDSAADSGTPDAFPLEGTWDDDWGGVHTIDTETWSMVYKTGTSVFHIETITLDETWLVARNDAANAWYPNLYSRFDWTLSEGSPWYCQVAWNATDPTAAAAAAAADPTDPATSGCGGYPWNRLVPHEG